MPKDVCHDVKYDVTRDQHGGITTQREIIQEFNDRANTNAKEQHLGEAKTKFEEAKGASLEAGNVLKEAAKDALAGVKEGVIETAKEVRNKAADVADAVKNKYRKLSESLHTNDSDGAHHVARGTCASHDVGTEYQANTQQYGANGGIQPMDAPNKAYEAKPGATVGAGSNVEYQTSVKIENTPTSTSIINKQAKHSGTNPNNGTGPDVEHVLKESINKGAEKMDDLRYKSSKNINKLNRKISEKMDDLRQKSS